MKTPISARTILVIASSGCLLTPALAQESSDAANYAEITKNWKCELCPKEQGPSGEVEGGVGYVTQDSAKFGQYTGLNEQGPYFIGNGDVRYLTAGAWYWNMDIANLGLSSRDISLEGGKQGSYTGFVTYDQIPDNLWDNTRTPFLGVGGNTLTLPDNWVPANTTQGMTVLPETLRNVDVDTQRNTVATGFSYIPAKDWEVKLRYSHIAQDGLKIMGGPIGASFGTARSAILLAPVDYGTDQVNLDASYTGKRFQGQIGYSGSFFTDGNKSLTWQNPFTDPSAPNGLGRSALAPDNQFNQWFVRAGYDLFPSTRVNGYFSYGRMAQDSSFLPYTTNPTLRTQPLPTSSLDGQVDVMAAKVNVASRPLDKLRLNAEWQYNERDNYTSQNVYDYVLMDTVISPNPQTNPTYSFRQNLLKLDAAYSLPMRTTLTGGVDYEKYQRTQQEVNSTNDWTFRMKLKTVPHDMVNLFLDYAHSNRTGTDYKTVETIVPPENPLLRKYYMADRGRNLVGTLLTVTPIDKISLQLGVDYAIDDYRNSSVGLTSDEDITYTVDLSYVPLERLTTHVFYTREAITSKQSGSAAFAAPNWFATNEDTVNTVGAGFKVAAIKDKLDFGVDYIWSQSTGQIDLSSPDLFFAPLPDLTTNMHSVRVQGKYKLKDNLSVKLAYWYQNYNSSDWALNNVAPNTISQVLSLGQQPYKYSDNVVGLSVLYHF
jgi:MtrB/PioB family decaheme-associated outer membrane protein